MDKITETIEAPKYGSWWYNEENELIQVINIDSKLFDTIFPVNFKYWDGPRTNEVTGSSIDEFYSNWKHKFN